MFYRQFTLVAIATLLLSPNLVQAREVYGDEEGLSVGNVQILNTPDGAIIQTPKIQVSTPIPSSRAVVSQTRRTRTSVRRTRTAAPLIFNKKVNSANTTVTTTNSGGNTRIMRSSTVRNSSDGSTQSTQSAGTDRQQSIECNGNGTTVSQSTSTVNGRTVSSQQTSCN